MINYDVETIKSLIRIAKAREASEASSFLLEFLENLVQPREFELFLFEIEKQK